MPTELSEYELKRKSNLEENQSLLRELGLDLKTTRLATPTETTFKKPKLVRQFAKKVPTPVRLSRRIRGQTPEEVEELVDEVDEVKRLGIVTRHDISNDDIVLPENIYAPISLRSIGTTIWSLGKLNTGKGRSKSWSSRGCKYKHPYPIGFKATKAHFGNVYDMEISLGTDGEPIFSVQVGSTVFTGKTPTAPWTEACIKSRYPSTRVSGPLFFGFSDPITMAMIKRMKGYEKTRLVE